MRRKGQHSTLINLDTKVTVALSKAVCCRPRAHVAASSSTLRKAKSRLGTGFPFSVKAERNWTSFELNKSLRFRLDWQSVAVGTEVFHCLNKPHCTYVVSDLWPQRYRLGNCRSNTAWTVILRCGDRSHWSLWQQRNKIFRKTTMTQVFGPPPPHQHLSNNRLLFYLKFI